jgi:hypothetical protein
MKRLLVLFLTGLVSLGGRTYGQNEVLVDSSDEIALAARYSLAQGVVWLKQRGAEDPEGWIIGPHRVRKVIGTTNITVRYTQKMVWQPVYSYTNVVAFVQETAGAPLRKVVYQKVVKQIGSNSVERMVPDRNGSISREEPYPLYDPSGNVSWPSRGIGDAALAAYALQKAGVPESDPVLDGVLRNLRNHIDAYGLPDQTWNLAWLTAVFSGVSGEKAKDVTQRLTSRLLDGQITDGPARGFWGTLSVNHGLLAVMVRDYLELMSDFQKKEAKLKLKPGKAAQAAVDELRESMDWFKSLAESEICQRGFRLSNVESMWVVEPRTDPVIMMPGADHMLYNQTAADMESTWVALFALSIASEHGRLPAQTWRPKLARKPGAPSLPSPERSDAVLARAVNALVAQQSKDGRWSECNQHQPVTKFDTFKSVLPVPCDVKSFPPLNSPVTALSSVQGMATLDSIGSMVGMKRLLSSFKAPYLSGMSGSRLELESRLKAVWPVPTVPPKFTREDYDLFLALSHPLAGLDESGAGRQDNEKMIRALVLAANPTGSWGKALYMWSVPSSSRARYEALKGMPVDMSKAHISPVHALWTDYSPLKRDSEGISTAVAVLYLAGVVDNPALVLTELAEQPQLNDLRREAVQRLMVKKMPKPVAAPAPVALASPPSTGSTGATIKTVPVTVLPEESDIPVIPSVPVDSRPKADETF